MKKLWVLGIGAICIMASCSKADDTSRCAVVTLTAPDSEIQSLKAHLDSNKINAIPDSRGFFYTILNAGDTSLRPTACASITATYTGRMLDGTQFDAANGAKFLLQNLIPAWKEAIPLIGKGGSIVFYAPPSLAYGSTVKGSIPANSNLYFAIELLDVQ